MPSNEASSMRIWPPCASSAIAITVLRTAPSYAKRLVLWFTCVQLAIGKTRLEGSCRHICLAREASTAQHQGCHCSACPFETRTSLSLTSGRRGIHSLQKSDQELQGPEMCDAKPWVDVQVHSRTCLPSQVPEETHMRTRRPQLTMSAALT